VTGPDADYAFDDPPLAPVPAGTSVLVTGSGSGPATSALARDLVLAGDDGTILVSTDTSGRRLLQACRRRGHLDGPRLAVVDATGSRDVGDDPDALTGSVSSTGDLTGISIEYSILHSALSKAGTERIRTCFDAVSTLLLYVSFPTVVRFVHTMAGRVAKTDGFGVFVLDPTMHEPQVTKTLERLCDGRIRLRRADESERESESASASGSEGHELRIDGLAGQPLGWSPVDLG
jgi:KaiC/GvpD/RAD55 family RecA-like ATPase